MMARLGYLPGRIRDSRRCRPQLHREDQTMQTKLAFAKKLATAALTLFTLLVWLSLSAQAQQKIAPPNRSLGPSAAIGPDCTTIEGNLFANCGFETGDFTGWTVLDSGFMFVDGGNPDNGRFAADLGSVGAVGCIGQTLATTPGQIY